MAPPRRPLLYPPPSPPSHPSPHRVSFPLPRSRLSTCLALFPLLFIASLLAFSLYAYTTLVIYLLFAGHILSGLAKGAVFLWLWAGCAGSVFMCWYRGGGTVPGIRKTSRDAEEDVAVRPLLEERNAFALGDEVSDSDDEEDATLLPSGSGSNGSRKPDHKLGARPARARARLESGELDMTSALRELHSQDQSPAGTGIQTKSNGKTRFCRKCDILKPDRSHHCSTCGSCVLKMDHHCPWLGGGCVGWANYKFFLLFLWYSSALGCYVAGSCMYELGSIASGGPDINELAPVTWAMAIMLGMVFGIALGFFGSYHFYLACTNRTTIESMETPASFLPGTSPGVPPLRIKSSLSLTRAQRKRLKKAGEQFNVYDLGMKNNLCQIFGGWDQAWLWAVPLGWPPGDGMTFPIDDQKLDQLRKITIQIFADDQLTASSTSFSDPETTSLGTVTSEDDRRRRRE